MPKEKSGAGRFRTVDFAFQNPTRSIGIFLEVKFARFTANHCLQVSKDIYKLSGLGPGEISKKESPKYVFKFVLVIGQLVQIRDRIKTHHRSVSKLTVNCLSSYEDERLLKQLEGALREGRGAGKDAGWVFEGLDAKGWKNCAVLFREQKWWAVFTRALRKSEHEDAVGALDEGEADADDLSQLTIEDNEDQERRHPRRRSKKVAEK